MHPGMPFLLITTRLLSARLPLCPVKLHSNWFETAFKSHVEWGHRYGLTSWRPWLTSLTLELASASASSCGLSLLQAAAHSSSWPPKVTSLFSLALLRALTTHKEWTPGEAQELGSRRIGMLRYLLRGPMYALVTR
jgi:hypothetical protein